MKFSRIMLLLAAFSSLCAFDWSSPAVICAKSATVPQVAVDSKGNAITVWVSTDQSAGTILSAYRRPGQDWTSIAGTVSEYGLKADAPQVAIDTSGRAIAIWVGPSNFKSASILASTWSGDGTVWNSPTLLVVSDKIACPPQLKVDGLGNCYAVWSIIQDGEYEIQTAVLHAGAADWNMLKEINVDLAQDLALAVNRNGVAVLLWVGHSHHKNIIQAAWIPAGASEWIQTRDLSPSNIDSAFPGVGIDDSGESIAIWQSGLGVSSTLESARLAANTEAWSEVKTSAEIQSTNFQPHLVVSPAGNAALVWIAIVNTSNLVIEGSSLNKGDMEWDFPEELSANSMWGAINPTVAMGDDGVAVAAWTYGAPGMIQTAQLPSPGRWSQATTVSLPIYDSDLPSIAMSPLEGAIIVYHGQDGDFNYVVQGVYGIESNEGQTCTNGL